MLLNVADLRAYRGGGGKQAASAFFRTTFWPKGVVPYVFETVDNPIAPNQRTLFIEAARELEKVARLKFVPRTNEVDFIRVFTDPTAIGFSYSAIGRAGGRQDLSLNAFGNRYVAVHEIMHALGLMHEQARSDRDNFVTIDFTNIGAGFQDQFAIIANSNNRGTYDFDSVMHYPAFAFATDPSKPTIIAKPAFAQFQNSMGQSDHISLLDAKGLADIYGSVGEIATPPNDFFSRAQLLEGPVGSVSGSNAFATKEPNEPSHAGSSTTSSIWYKWRPANGGTVTFTTRGSAIDTTLAVYLGLSVRTLTPVTSNDDAVIGATTPEEGLFSSVTFPAQAGAIYYIAVDSAAEFFNQFKTSETGATKLNWNQNVVASRSKISGVIKTSRRTPLAGVSVALSGLEPGNMATKTNVVTNAAGEYSIAGLLPGAFSLRPSKPGFSFTPTLLRIRVNGNSSANDFTAVEIPLSNQPDAFVSDVTMREGQVGESFVTFNVSISAPSREPITINYATVDGTASSSSDYSALRGTLSFAPGVTTLVVRVRVRPDVDLESNETFGLKISNAAGAKIVDELGVATLVNDDLATQ